MKRPLRWAVTLCLLSGAFAAPILAAPQSQQTDAQATVTQPVYLARLTQLRTLVETCRQHPESCDSPKVGPDLTLQQGASNRNIRFGWLRATLEAARDPHANHRGDLLQSSLDRLTQDAEESAAPITPATQTDKARTAADTILSQPEFRAVVPSSAVQQAVALFLHRLDQAINGAVNRLPSSRWLTPLLEWGALALAAAGLLLWLWRSSRRQRLAVATHHSTGLTPWQTESDDWAARAQLAASGHHWREAVHCLYWSAIVLLEGRKAWRPNRARTPREYLILLEPGSPRRTALESLTVPFERIWYGIRPAVQSDYERAQALLEQIRGA